MAKDGKGQDKWSKAPYNFVQIPEVAIPAPLNDFFSPYQGGENIENMGTRHRADLFQKYIEKNVQGEGKERNCFSGEIQLEITTETPCFVGWKLDSQGEDMVFYAPNGTKRIPGSSIRGMVKNIFKLLTCSAMRKNDQDSDDGDFQNRHLYFRSMASLPVDFRNYYKSQITGVCPGFLVGKGREYFIIPANAEDPRPQVPGSSGERGQGDAPRVIWKDESCECYTAKMGRKKHYDIFYPIKCEDKENNKSVKYEWEKNRIHVTKEIMEDYLKDTKRGNANNDEKKEREWNLFAGENLCLKGQDALDFTEGHYDFIAPCHYQSEGEELLHFGFGLYYRIPYQSDIAAHIPQTLQSSTIVDFSDAVFGRKEFWAGRVFFGDAELKSGGSSIGKKKTHPLMSPNPTSFQLYLNSDNGRSQHWDATSKPRIRGYKFYWHKSCTENDWQMSAEDKDIEGTYTINPIAAGSSFEGSIRFESLTKIELGALLSVFDLAKDRDSVRYKIGMGKPLGMGTVKIGAKLRLLDVDTAYSSLLGGAGWENNLVETDETLFLQEFSQYMEKKCRERNCLESYEMLCSELLEILDARQEEYHANWKETTRYMKLEPNEFKDRRPLQTISQIVSERK